MNYKILTSKVIGAFAAAVALISFLASSPASAGVFLGYLAVLSVGAIGGLEYGLQRQYSLKK